MEIVFEYQPKAKKLTAYRNGKAVGGFIGNNAEREFMNLVEKNVPVSLKLSDMKNQKSSKVQRLRALWIKQNVDQYRESIMEPYGVSSTKDLTEKQLDELIERFTHNNSSDAPLPVRTERSLILKLLTELGVYDNSANWHRVNAYLMDKRIAGKMLYQMNIEELRTLSIKLRAIKVKYAADKAETERLMRSN